MLQKVVNETGGFLEVLLSCGMVYAKLINYLAFRTMLPFQKCFYKNSGKNHLLWKYLGRCGQLFRQF